MNLFLEQVFFFLLFLFPLTTYLTVLAGINRREHPAVVPGLWDAVGVLFASSGFFIAAGPAVLSALYGRGVRALLTQEEGGWLLDFWNNWGILWGLYYGALVCASLFLLLWRRQTTVIYNVEPAAFDAALTQALENLGLAWTRLGNRVFLRPAVPQPADAPLTAAEQRLPAGVGTAPHSIEEEIRPVPTVVRPVSLRIEPFPALYNVTLHWGDLDRDLRDAIENELRRTLSNTATRYNPMGGWLLGISGTLFAVMFITILFLLFAILVVGAR